MMEDEVFQRLLKNAASGNIFKPKRKAIRRVVIHVSGDMESVKCFNCVRVNGYVETGEAGNCAYIDGDVSKILSAGTVRADTVDMAGKIKTRLFIETRLDISMPKPGNPLYVKPKRNKGKN